ncbi:hypothetical protein [Streptomyces sp. NBC_01092]|uniref:caspase, EACC1-associated type n=1 Tax=Streptomyces sp. NBC_01092 TaxID=2903748 RepID=UPI0038700FB7|nr:hypothetical protein OG254_06900 [Streptomyces sp. NBC_01092]
MLIGVPKYEHPEFPPIPAALNSLQAVRDLLLDSTLCGWKDHQVTVIDDVSSAEKLIVQVANLVKGVTGNLLLYLVGHGMLSTSGELCLVMPRTQPEYPKYTGLVWRNLAEVLLLSPAKARITIMDCCFAGQAIEALGTGDAQVLADLTQVNGSYTLTATTRNRTAHVVPLGEQTTKPTSFTEHLCDVVRSGIPGRSPHLTLNDIYPVLRTRLQAKGLPLPNQRGTDTAGHVVFARNMAASPAPVEPTISGNSVILDETENPFEERVSRLVTAWAARDRGQDWLVTGRAFFALYLWWWHDNKRLAGALTQAYVEHSYEFIGGEAGWVALLSQRARCACHNETWHVENISICLNCLRYQCYQAPRECGGCGGHIVG